MTKSRTLRKAGAVALSLAMALSIAGTTPAQAASKVKLSSTKGTITVGKTKKVTIKNTKKSNIKKVTFKYSNTKKRVTAKRSGLTLKFKGNKAGTVTITSKITLKKAVAGKKTYSLKYKATVKKATPAATATPGELKLEKVESAGRITTTAAVVGGVNILVAYFSSAMSEINPNDVEIRRVSDNKLFTVEKITLASDKKSATMTLTGTAAAAANTDYLQSNVTYKMIVKTSTKTLEKEFIIPIVLDNVVVTAVDAKNKKLSLNGTAYDLGEGVTVDDYFDILGKTVTAEIDNTGKITKLNVIELKTVIGAFTYTAATATASASYKEAVSGTVYNATAGAAANATTYPTQTVQYNAKFAAAAAPAVNTGANTIPGANLAWGKLVLNPDGTIRTVQGIATLPNSAYIKKAEAGVVTNGADVNTNVKDYVIIKDGKLIDNTTIAAGDVLVYNAADQVGYITNASVTGVFTKDYGTSYVFADKEYKQPTVNLKDAKEAKLTTAGISDLITAKTSLTLYTGIDGLGIYAVGEAAALTSEVTLFVTSSGTSGDGDAASATVTGFNPATGAMETYSWTGSMKSLTNAAVNALCDDNFSVGEPKKVLITVSASDNKVVKDIADKSTATLGPNATPSIDGTVASGAETITKSTKYIGSTTGDGMDPSKAKVIVFKNPSSATTKFAASNFTVYDFASWTGKLTAAAGKFAGTWIYGTLSKNVDFILVDGAQQTSAGTVGVEAGDEFIGFVTSVANSTNKRIEVINKAGKDTTYETFNTTINLGTDTAANTFNQIKLSKTYDTDKTVFSIAKANNSVVTSQTTGAYAAAACDGKTLSTTDTHKSFTLNDKTLAIAHDVAKNTYTLGDLTAIKRSAEVEVYTATANTSIATAVLYTTEPVAAGEAAVVAEEAYTAAKAQIDAITFKIEGSGTGTAKITPSDVSAIMTTAPSTTVSGAGQAGLAVASGVTTITPASDDTACTVTYEYQKDGYTRTIVFKITTSDTHTKVAVVVDSDTKA